MQTRPQAGTSACGLSVRRSRRGVPSRRGAMRGFFTCYLALFFVIYITFVGAPRATSELRCQHASPATVPSIRWVQFDHRPTRIEVYGLSADTLKTLSGEGAEQRQQSLLRVSVAPRDNLEQPAPMLGSYVVEEGVLAFEPRFPLSRGVTYLAKLLMPDSTAEVTEDFTLPNPRPAEPTEVQEIYPSGNELPANQLKFYVYFTAPMSRGQAYRHIRLLKDDGREVENAFLEIAEELWDRDATRFMLLLDPGRVKRELKPREEEGPVLEEGHRYSLVIDRAWLDATGFELKQTVRKEFKVTSPDELPPDPAKWKIIPPRRSEPLIVQFPEPLDQALLERVLWVETADGQSVSGEVAIDEQETRWWFRPVQPWDAQANYVLAVERILEDRAGNRIGRKFEVDVFDKVDQQITTEVVRIPFSASE